MDIVDSEQDHESDYSGDTVPYDDDDDDDDGEDELDDLS